MEQVGPVTSRGQLALRQRINTVLEKFTQETLKEPDKKVEEFFEGITIHITTHLFSSLKKCLQQGSYDIACEVLKYLVENRQCSKQFIWKMMTTIMNKDCTFFVPLLSEISNSLVNTKGIHHDEIHLVNTIHLLNKEIFDRAHQEASKFDGKGLSTDDMAKTAIATSALLAGYKTILEYQLVQPGDSDSLTNMKHSFELLIEKNSYLPMFAEAYTFVLIQLGLQKEAEEFIYKYVESGGVIVVEHAIDIVKLHMPKTSQRLIFGLLEMIAIRSSSHPKVLDLCRQHLCIHNSRTRNHSDTESNLDFDSDEDSDVVDNHANLNKCLELIFNFMDPYVDQLPTPLIKEGWNIMSDTMRRICLQGEDDCLNTIVKLWHNDRKRWWTCFYDQPPSVLLPGDAELYSNMASYASISPASSISSGYTPKMEFGNTLPQPTEVIPNPQCFPFPDFDVFSACSSQTEDIANSITQALSRLDGDVADNALDLVQTQTRTGASVAELTLPEERTVVSSFVRYNFGPPSGIDPESEEYVLEAEIDLPEQTLISNRSFSRDFENSSPDMFLSLSENESSSEDKSKGASNSTGNTRTIKPIVEEETVHDKEPDQQKGEFDRLSTVSAPPIAVSSPAKKRRKKQKVYSEGTEVSRTTEPICSEETIDDHEPYQRKEEFDALPTVSAPRFAVTSPTKKKKKKIKVDSEDTDESRTTKLKIYEATIHDEERDQWESGFNSLSTMFATSISSPAKKKKKKQKVDSEGEKPRLKDEQIETCELSPSMVTIRTLSGKKKAKKKHIRRSSELEGWNVELVKTVPRKAHTRERDPDYWSDPEDESVHNLTAEPSFKTTPELKTKKLKLKFVKKNLIDSLEDQPIASTSKTPKISVKCTSKLKEKTKKPIPKAVETPREYWLDAEDESVVDLTAKSSFKTTPELKNKKLNSTSVRKNLVNSLEDEPIASTSKTHQLSVKSSPKLKKKTKKSIPKAVETPRASNSPDDIHDVEEEIRLLIEKAKLSIKKTETTPAKSPKKRKRLLTESKIAPRPRSSSSDSEKESLIQEILNNVSSKKKSKTKKKSKRSSTSSNVADATFDFRKSIASVINNFLGSDSSDEDDKSMSPKKKKS